MAKKKRLARWEGDPEHTPLSVIIKWVDEEKGQGCICPACGQNAKVYRRKMDGGQVHDMIRLYNAGGTDKFIYMAKSVNGGGLARLRHWGLVVEGDESGTWKVTEKGVAFLKKYITVPKRVVLFNRGFYGYHKEHERINVVDALGSPFDYDDLMGS